MMFGFMMDNFAHSAETHTPKNMSEACGLDFKHLWSCDVDKNIREFIKRNFAPEQIFHDVNKPRSLPPANIYAAGFPCTPFSKLHASSGEWQEKAARAGRAVLRTVQKQQFALAVLENVEGLRDRPEAWQTMLKHVRRYLSNYYVFVVHLCPTMLCHAVSRPRLYFVCVHQSVAKTNDVDRMQAAILRMLSSGVAHFARFPKPTWESFLLKGAAVSLGNTRQPKEGCKWLSLNAEVRKGMNVSHLPKVSGLTVREQDTWEIAVSGHPTAQLIAADVSQSANRVPSRFNGTLPVITPHSKIVIRKAGGVCRLLTAHEKMFACGAPVERYDLEGVSEGQMKKWAGNTMDIKCVSLALLLGMNLCKWPEANRTASCFESWRKASIFEIEKATSGWQSAVLARGFGDNKNQKQTKNSREKRLKVGTKAIQRTRKQPGGVRPGQRRHSPGQEAHGGKRKLPLDGKSSKLRKRLSQIFRDS